MADFGTWVGVGDKPQVASAASIGDTVRVTFSEPMTNDANLVLAGNYTFFSIGGVFVTTVSVVPGPGANPTYVDLTLDHSPTIGSNYAVTVATTVKDKAGNILDPAHRTANFVADAVRATFIAQVWPTNLTRVRVTYSKAVKQVNPANPDDALNPANYSITGGVLVGSVISISPTIVDLVVSGQQTGHSYTLTITGVEDTSGNEVA